MLLVALTVPLVLQVVRVLFPIVYGLGERTSFGAAGGLALLLFLSPALVPLRRRILGPRRALTVAVAGLVGARLAIQAVHPVPLGLAIAATVLALLALAVLLESGIPGERFVLGALVGLSLDTAVRSGFLTWDHAWRDGVVPMTLTILFAAGSLLALRAHTALTIEGIPRLSGFALGPFLFLHLVFLQSIAFLGSQSGLSVPAASAVVLVGNALAIAGVAWLSDRASPLPLTAGIVLVGAAFFVRDVSGAGVVPVVLAGHVLAAGLLLSALRADRRASPEWRRSLGVTAGTVVFAALVLVYQLHYDRPLPFRNALLVPAAAALLVIAAIRAFPWRPIHPRSDGLTVIPVLLIAVPASLIPGGADVRIQDPVLPTFRLVSYNVHSAVNGDGQLDPEATARTIEREDPDVVFLQEIGRGWAISGTIDLAEWLSRRLDLPYVYAPAADGQFGNVLLSRLPILESETGFLPKVAGPMRRSYVKARIEVGTGSVTFIGTHLQNRGSGTRLRQIDVLLRRWGGTARTVIAGDMNATPGSREIGTLEGAGLVSAQDVAGDPALLTAFLPDPDRRIDWIFGTGDVVFSDFQIPTSAASDHLPLVVTVTVPSTA